MDPMRKIKPTKKVKYSESALSSGLRKLRTRGPWPLPAERMTDQEAEALKEAHEWQLSYEHRKRHLRRMAKLDAEEGDLLLAHIRTRP